MRRLTPFPSLHSRYELISKIYDAALNPARWQSVLNAIRMQCGADQCTIFYYDSVHKHQSIAAAARTKPTSIETYFEKFIELQARQVRYQFALLPEGVVVMDKDIKKLAGNNYADIVGDQYMHSLFPNLQFQAGAVLKRSKLACAGIGLHCFKNSPMITFTQVELLQDLTPHLMRALDIHQALVNTGGNFNTLKCLFNQISQGVVLMNEQHEIQFLNNAARDILEKSPHIKISENHHLQLDDTIHVQENQPLKLRQLKRKIENSENLICIDEKWGKLKISAFHLHTKHPAGKPLTDTHLQLYGSYMLVIQDSHHKCDIPYDYLQQAYHITPAEFDLINELVNGCNLGDAARQRDVTKETARWQLKSIMQKTHTHSQSELSRLMLAFCDN